MPFRDQFADPRAGIRVDVVVEVHGVIRATANKCMLATAGVALLVYSESSARRARSLALCRIKCVQLT